MLNFTFKLHTKIHKGTIVFYKYINYKHSTEIHHRLNSLGSAKSSTTQAPEDLWVGGARYRCVLPSDVSKTAIMKSNHICSCAKEKISQTQKKKRKR